MALLSVAVIQRAVRYAQKQVAEGGHLSPEDVAHFAEMPDEVAALSLAGHLCLCAHGVLFEEADVAAAAEEAAEEAAEAEGEEGQE